MDRAAPFGYIEEQLDKSIIDDEDEKYSFEKNIEINDDKVLEPQNVIEAEVNNNPIELSDEFKQ